MIHVKLFYSPLSLVAAMPLVVDQLGICGTVAWWKTVSFAASKAVMGKSQCEGTEVNMS